MSKLKDLLKSPHIQIALATGVSIIVMAYFSKRILSKPIGYLPAAIPPFLAVVYECILSKYKKNAKTWFWVAAILITTAVIIIAYSN